MCPPTTDTVSRGYCFLIMPMGDRESEVRQRSKTIIKAISPVLVEFGYEPIAPWDLNQPGLITQEIAKHLLEDPLVIADLSGGNANVFYELAVRHCLRKPCIQLVMANDPIPFDVGAIRTIEIVNSIEGLFQVGDDLRNVINAIIDNPGPVDNLVTRFLDIERLGESDKPIDRGFVNVLTMLTELSGEVVPLRRQITDTRDTILEQIRSFEEQSEKIRLDLAKGIVKTDDGIFRALKYDQKKGMIYYGNNASAEHRNVLLNNETLKVILAEAKKIALNGEGSPDADSVLYSLGSAASARFARHFEQYMHSEHSADFDLQNWLHHWQEYDSDAGFGHMEVLPIHTGHDEGSEIVEISVHNSFLTHNMQTRDPNDSLCRFMVGYIEGLLKSLSPDLYEGQQLDHETICVTHKWADCFLKHRNARRGCIFKAEVAKLSS